ncbi:hypothetical protein VIBHAR_03252 [Vibrio campbellii ATCC BAA-1116]|uniref:Uncharacterized protein n=1 Tax=Vibrio campbellii (strain ATCC BAA-1116) TaxID=2902295 RepID=A7N1V8_VIBC1|nr:hypothetical protein VIBHAR_03252 [Vibrio campbellii ATCC BAA-1116]
MPIGSMEYMVCVLMKGLRRKVSQISLAFLFENDY